MSFCTDLIYIYTDFSIYTISGHSLQILQSISFLQEQRLPREQHLPNWPSRITNYFFSETICSFLFLSTHSKVSDLHYKHLTTICDWMKEIIVICFILKKKNSVPFIFSNCLKLKIRFCKCCRLNECESYVQWCVVNGVLCQKTAKASHLLLHIFTYSKNTKMLGTFNNKIVNQTIL